MQLAAWIAFCAVAAVLTRNHPRLYLSAVVVAWFAIPAVGSSLVTGEADGPLSFHPATWLVAAIAGVQLLHTPRALAAALARQVHVFLGLALVAGAAVITTVAGGGSSVALIDQLLAPVMFFLLILAAGLADRGLLTVLKNLLLTLAAAVSIVALAQTLTGQVIFYESGFLTQYWFDPEDNRWMGTLDQPLALSLALCMIAPLAAGVRRPALQLVLLVLLGAGVLVSQSRLGIVTYALVAAFAVLRSRIPWQGKLSLAGLLATAAWFAAGSTVSAGVAQRFADDTGSAAARADAWGFFLTRWQDYLVAGEGISASYRVSEAGGLITSLESSVLMYAVDIGVVFALVYFGVMAGLIARNWRQQACPGLALGSVLGLLIVQTYSALATRSVAGILIWTMLALLVLAGRQSRTPEEPRTPEEGAAGTSSGADGPRLRPIEAQLAAAMRAAAAR
ncbi:hypothetical protein NCCP1664_11670 [Zafaria cholistanensis]|uniref:Uncharacterized protein n=1 Tax=Zafaria cholistanensis TaxID=1682741 RepID=A0A5A7NPF0_9MICC|nr:hypothetical protein [Zafaria cholistanensis]GER22670.1 hypothetical protein NCCP1664_11670 [Zafaria cholistanensis]